MPTADRPQHPLAKRTFGTATATGSSAPGDTSSKGKANKATGAEKGGDGRPFITLAHFLKWRSLVPTGGAAKTVVRDGVILVNGKREDRPGRKLHNGDQVTIDGTVHSVTVSP